LIRTWKQQDRVKSLEDLDLDSGTPAAEVDIDENLIRQLIRAQRPQFAKLDISPTGTGWDNAVFRLGTEFAVRLPRRAIAAKLIRREQKWLSTVANRVSIPVPSRLYVGVPCYRYPWFWSIVPWIKGEPADVTPPGPAQASRLAGFLRALHVKTPNDAPFNPWRGVPLRNRSASVEERLERLAARNIHISSHVVKTWQSALRARDNSVPTWIHGDLHARNVLVQDGAITGIIDWGDMCSGDPATDLAAVWMLFSERAARASVT
jgi:aminoglycoside phosphotransferase (APT) family kinase protein